MMDLRATLCYLFFLSATEILGGDAQMCATAGAVQLVGFNSLQVGIVQVCKEGHWGTVCGGSSWGKKSSLVTCRQLGFPDTIDLSVIDRLDVVPASSPIHYSSVQCTGLEERLTDCMMESSNVTACSHSDDVVVMCKQSPREGDIRLVGQGPQNEGILEFYSREHGWATLCTSDWDDSDAQVACIQLGYEGGKSNTSRFIPRRGSLPRKRYNNFDCSGSETSLLDCRFSGPFPIRCYTADYAAVQCRKSGADESVSLNISILILLTGVAFCLIAGLSIALKCTVSRLRKQNNMDNEDCSSTEGRNYGPHRIPRVTLDSSAWTDRQLDLFTSLAPPSYEDAVLTDQNVQAQPQQQDILPPQPPTTTEGTTNERPAGNEDSSHRDNIQVTDYYLRSASSITISTTPDSQEEDSCTVNLTTSKHSAETVLSEQRNHVVQVEET